MITIQKIVQDLELQFHILYFSKNEFKLKNSSSGNPEVNCFNLSAKQTILKRRQ